MNKHLRVSKCGFYQHRHGQRVLKVFITHIFFANIMNDILVTFSVCLLIPNSYTIFSGNLFFKLALTYIGKVKNSRKKAMRKTSLCSDWLEAHASGTNYTFFMLCRI